MSSDRRVLESQLAKLLSFDIEDAIDVIDHILAFESEDDLLEHMCALIGDDNQSVKTFVSNVLRFQKGEALGIDSSEEAVVDSADIGQTSQAPKIDINEGRVSFSPMVSRQRQESMRLEKEKKEKKQQQELERKREIEEERKQLEKLEKMRVKQMKALEELRKRQEEEDRKMREEAAESMAAAKTTDSLYCEKKETKKASIGKAETRSKPHAPKKEKEIVTRAIVACGCFGTIYKPLTNCLHCGRIICEKEGYGRCPSCGNLVEKPKVSVGAGKELDKATLHKERLLKFDRDSASRTVVYDDQADYFQNSTSTWLTNEEQKDAGIQEEKRRRDLHTIKKHVLNIQF